MSRKNKAVFALSVIMLLGALVFVVSFYRLEAATKNAQAQGFDIGDEDCTYEDRGIVCRRTEVREDCALPLEKIECVMKETVVLEVTCCLWPMRHAHGELACQVSLDPCSFDL